MKSVSVKSHPWNLNFFTISAYENDLITFQTFLAIFLCISGKIMLQNT